MRPLALCGCLVLLATCMPRPGMTPGARRAPPLSSPPRSDPDLSGLVGQTATVHYSHGEGTRLRLDPPGSYVEDRVPLRGSTSDRVLWLEITRQGLEEKRSVWFFPPEGGAFDMAYLLKDGPGEYTFRIFGSRDPRSTRYALLASFTLLSIRAGDADRPELYLNRRILEFVDAFKGQQVGEGECGDLIEEALLTHWADWSGGMTFGRPVDPEREPILPGDIVLFHRVVVEDAEQTHGFRSVEHLGDPNHVAIVYRNLGRRRLRLAHQNIQDCRKVRLTRLDLDRIVSGEIRFFRPLAGLVEGAKGR